jgi:DNA-3-methyladenine glycosylase II
MATMVSRELRIEPVGPFSWQLATDFATSWAALRHQVARAGGGVALSFLSDRTFTPVGVGLDQRNGGIHAQIAEPAAAQGDVATVVRQAARIFSLDHDATSYPAAGRRDPAVGKLMEILPGLRPLNFSSPYECAVWAVLSQRINQNQAASIKRQLIAAHGTTFDVGGVEVGCVPAPDELLAVKTFPGIPALKIERLHGVARAALEGALDPDRLISLGDAAPAALRVIPGIGPFWSQGIYMRSCSVADVWPVEPLANAALGALHGLGDQPSAEDIARLTDVYRPWRTWVCVLLRFAAGRGIVQGVAGRESEIRRRSHSHGATLTSSQK